MTPERWREITGIFQAAIARDREARAAFVAEECADDTDLRREIEGMLAAHDQSAGSTISAVRLIPGTLAHYQIVRLIGSGGMGDVYLAHDTRLDRQVALKILPPELSDDAERSARFTREAKAVAALNHPNVVTLYSVEEADGVRFITMELVRGRTLADILPAGGLPLARFFDIAVPLADALCAAHQQNITHRDLKPSNIMVADDGRVKVLDFGLAKAQPDSSQERAALDTLSGTRDGHILGTPAYMSPEQAEGKTVDYRSDIFSLGILFYQALTGERPFHGSSAAALASSILRDVPPDLHVVRPGIAEGLARSVHRCLEKTPADRYQSALDLRNDLEAARRAGDVATSPVRTAHRTRTRVTLWLAASALLIAAAAVLPWRAWNGNPSVRTLAVLPFTNVGNDDDLEYLCDGITENLIQRISRLQSVSVMARSTVLNFKGKPVDPREAGRQLRVDVILTGGVSRQSGRLRITAELVDVATGVQLWGNSFDRAETEVMQVLDDISTEIVDQGIQVRPSRDEQRALTRHPTTDPEAYEFYLRARHAIMRNTEADTLQARELLVRATERDPQFAIALVALANTFIGAAVDGFERPTEAFPEALRISRRALEIDPQVPLGRQNAAAIAFFFDWDWAAVERDWRLETLLENPTLPVQELMGYSLSRWVLAGPGDALGVVRKLRELDPISPAYIVLEADFLFHTGQIEAAAALYQKALDVDEMPDALFGLAEIRRAQGRFDEAIDARGRAHQAAGDDFLDEILADARGEEGYRLLEMTAARHDLDTLRDRQATAYVSPLDVARAHALLGNKDQAFSFIEQAFADRTPGLVFLKVDRAWDAIRDDPRFLAAVRRLRLP